MNAETETTVEIHTAEVCGEDAVLVLLVIALAHGRTEPAQAVAAIKQAVKIIVAEGIDLARLETLKDRAADIYKQGPKAFYDLMRSLEAANKAPPAGSTAWN